MICASLQASRVDVYAEPTPLVIQFLLNTQPVRVAPAVDLNARQVGRYDFSLQVNEEDAFRA